MTDGWGKQVKETILQPKEFFSKMPTSGGYGEPFRFALINIVIGAVGSLLNLVATARGTDGGPSLELVLEAIGVDIFSLSVIWITSISIVGALGLFLSAAIYHVVLKIVGAKKNYEATFRIMAAMSAFYLVSWIPYVNILVALYMLYAFVVAFQEVHEITLGRAVVALVLMIVAALVIALIVMVIITTIAYVWFGNMQEATMQAGMSI